MSNLNNVSGWISIKEEGGDRFLILSKVLPDGSGHEVKLDITNNPALVTNIRIFIEK